MTSIVAWVLVGLLALTSAAPAPAPAAAHHTLVARVPARAAGVDARYADYLAGIPDGPAKANGIQVGDRVAATILGLRAGDGLDNQIP
jgi:hypothetical protein